jgi:hypothetical protein
LNLLDVDAVPITLFIDSEGIIIAVNPPLAKADSLLQVFISDESVTKRSDGSKERGKIALSMADSLLLWHHDVRINEVIGLYNQELDRQHDKGSTHFKLGVACRMRYDKDMVKHSGDFQLAVGHWQNALQINPNQHIWRRRIQQYGPRLDKPYPFYDWVPRARTDIVQRGEQPIELSIEPGGAEYARPQKNWQQNNHEVSEPDPAGRIIRDSDDFILSQTTSVPANIAGKEVYRVHVDFHPNPEKKTHWNNEAGNFEFWLQLPDGWVSDSRHFILPNPDKEISNETRRIEFELKQVADEPRQQLISAYALYYICEDTDSTCLYRRQDIEIQVEK